MADEVDLSLGVDFFDLFFELLRAVFDRMPGGEFGDQKRGA